MAEAVTGASLDWSEVAFSEPVAALDAVFYVVFRLPEGSEHTADGYGGGAGIGYTEGPNGFTGWFSLDGEEWTKLQDSFGMAVQPITVEVEEGMMAKIGEEAEEPLVTHTAFLLPAPNPFNPQTERSEGDVQGQRESGSNKAIGSMAHGELIATKHVAGLSVRRPARQWIERSE